MNHGEKETCEQTKKRLELLMKGVDVCKSGYGGILPSGQIVDRREFPDAIPMQENALFGTPKPNSVK